MDLDAEHSVVILLDVLELVSSDHAVVEFDTAEDLLVVFLLELAVKGYLIDLLLVVRRMSELLGDLTVVCEHKHTSCVLVETAYREYS